MSIALRPPKFRVPHRLLAWMQVNGIKERVPAAENVFLKDNPNTLRERAFGLAQYARTVGRLPSELEQVVLQVPDACVEYASQIKHVCEVPSEVVDVCGEDANNVIRMARVLNSRIQRLENKIDTPDLYVGYVSSIGKRVAELEEEIFFSGKFPAKTLAKSVLGLIEAGSPSRWGSLPDDSPANDDRMKEILKGDSNSVLAYMKMLNGRGLKLPSEFHWVFAGDGEKLYALADHIRGRLPSELERTWEGGKQLLVQYAVKWVRGRLPECLEDVLLGDAKAVADYAFAIVRGFANPRLGDALHNFMLLEQDNPDSKRYVAECERIRRMIPEA